MSRKKEFSSRPFEKLRKNLERRAESVSAPLRQTKTEELSEEELFNHAMDDVHVIEAFRTLSCERRDTGRASGPDARRDPDDLARSILSGITEGTEPIHLPDTQEYVEWSNPDHGHFFTEQLHEGRFSVQDFLDLHGFTAPEAGDELDTFLENAFARGLRCVKIIHGRGLRSVKGPRIKDAVIRRLLGRYRKDVIAFTSARQCDGGLGAIYVLLAGR